MAGNLWLPIPKPVMDCQRWLDVSVRPNCHLTEQAEPPAAAQLPTPREPRGIQKVRSGAVDHTLCSASAELDGRRAHAVVVQHVHILLRARGAAWCGVVLRCGVVLTR